MNRRIFYFAGYRLKVFEWRHNKLLGSCSFEPDEEGFENFAFYLKNAPQVPSQLLVDLVEEDFRRENIPHVVGSAHKALITRLIDRHYRDESHIHIEKLGREKEGRKDDKILLSALTNQALLKPWLDLLHECECPLAGIWSVPLISKQLLPLIAPDEKNVLLLSRLILTAQRETYFKDGALMLSRQAKFDRDKRDSDNTLVSKESLTSGVQQIQIFLTNQRIMAFNEVLNVYCMVPGEFLPSLTNKQLDTEKIKYHYVDLSRIFKHYKIKKTDDYGADVLYSFLCARMPLLKDHYATLKEKLFFHRYLVSKSIRIGALLGSLMLLLSAGLLFLNVKEINQKRQLMEVNQQLLAKRYAQDFVPLEQPLIDSPNIQASVELAKKLAIETENSPEQYFAIFSPVLSQPEFADINLESFAWKKYSAQDLAQLLTGALASVSEAKPDAYAEEVIIETSPEESLQVLVTLSGFVNRKTRSYREMTELMQNFTAQLKSLKGVTQLVVLKMPIDLRPGISFTDEQVADKKLTSYDQEKIKNEYQILIGFDINQESTSGDLDNSGVVYE
jgi:hypothetical protein